MGNPGPPVDAADTPGKPRRLRLDELMVARGLAATPSQAQRLIMAGHVMLADGEPAAKPGHLVREDATITLRQGLRYVSRGGLKLEAALEAFGIRPIGWVCADVGASTGGFTDCLLQWGAARVYSIDVGYGQLAWSLRQDARVISIERANVRQLDALPEPVHLATVDVSFISLSLVLPHVVALLDPAGQLIALIKPQFEVDRGQVGRGGVVRDAALHREVILKRLADADELGMAASGLIRSPIVGPAGNVEFLMWLLRKGERASPATMERWIDACLAPPRPAESVRRQDRT